MPRRAGLESERAGASARGSSLLVAIEQTPLDQQLAQEATRRSATTKSVFVKCGLEPRPECRQSQFSVQCCTMSSTF
jgi:hypothetical protein